MTYGRMVWKMPTIAFWDSFPYEQRSSNVSDGGKIREVYRGFLVMWVVLKLVNRFKYLLHFSPG